MLTIENISCYKNDKKIFTNLGLSLFLGAALVVTGKNGSGKTSLLKIIAGLSKESKGNILWAGENINSFRSDFNKDLQFVGHKNFFKDELTILENLLFYAKLHQSQHAILAALRFFKLEEKIDDKFKNLSAGFKKRALLAKLMVCPALIWILDEPSDNLDLEGKNLLINLIKTKIDNGGIVIIATHDDVFFDLGARLKIEDYN